MRQALVIGPKLKWNSPKSKGSSKDGGSKEIKYVAYYIKSAIFSKKVLFLLVCHCRVRGIRAESLLKLS